MDTPHTDDRTTTPPQGDELHQGISNRESAAEEDRERKENPPLDVVPDPPETPAHAHKVDGAFGSE